MNTRLSLLASAAFAAFVLPFPLRADTEVVNGIEWTYTVSDGKASVGEGTSSTAVPKSTSGTIAIPSSLGGYPVTSIGDRAFFCCKALTSATIPDSVTSIGRYAFYSCKGLTSVTIPHSVTSIGDYAFEECSKLTSVTIPDSVTRVGNGLFQSCSGLTSVTIPDSLTSIGDYMFTMCGRLTYVTIPDSVTSIGHMAFCYCSLTSVTIPSSVTSIGDWAFAFCNFTSVTIPDGVTEIKANTFCGCDSLKSMTIPYSVTSIGYMAFDECSELTSVTIPDSVTSIGGLAFASCYNLRSLKIPASVTSLTDNVFKDSGLEVLYLPSQFEGRTSSLMLPEDCAVIFHSRKSTPPYKVAFKANGGKGKMAAQTINYGQAAKLRKNVFTRTGWIFVGWAVKKGGAVAYRNAQVVLNLRADGKTVTLYAVWAKKTYKVAFYANGGKGTMAVQKMTYGKAQKLSANKFKAPKGKKFAGWATSKANAKKGVVKYKNKQSVKNLVTTGKTVKLYAVWKKR